MFVISCEIALETSPRLLSLAALFARASDRWRSVSDWMMVARSSIVNLIPSLASAMFVSCVMRGVIATLLLYYGLLMLSNVLHLFTPVMWFSCYTGVVLVWFLVCCLFRGVVYYDWSSYASF